MSKELVIGANRHETKVAILEEDQLVEVYFQRANEYSLAGSIHKGRVTRVLPGMQSAFVDLGLERDTFLYVSDFFEENDDIDTVTDDKAVEKPVRNDGRDRGDRGRNRSLERAGEQRTTETRGTEAREQRNVAAMPVHAEALPAQLPVQPPAQSMGESAPETMQPLEAVAEKAESDRNDNQSDRRGRRSRRRRTRGGGIPENKYAQPSGPSPDRSTPFVSHQEPSGEAPKEVVLLPGESLAKYRNVVEISEAPHPVRSAEKTSAENRGNLSPEYVTAPLEPELDAEYEQEVELESEAEELELADKIFSHHDLSIEAEEEKIEQVKEDLPESEFLVEDFEADDVEEPLGSEEESTLSDADHSKLKAAVLDRGELPSFSSATLTDAVHSDKGDLFDEERFEADEPPRDLLQLDEFETAEIQSLAGGHAHGEDVTVLEKTLPGSEAGQTPSEQSTQSQSAVLREQGGRYLHRSSRRMRRRRGGSNNRLAQEGSPVEGSPETGTAAGAAAVMQPTGRTEPRSETRTESRTEARFESRNEPKGESRNESKREFDEERSSDRPERVMPLISDLLKPGQEIIVQIAKEPLGQKGARITSHVALPGRYVVFMPSVHHLGVSRKVASDEERQRLKRILQTHRVGTTGGFIVRTAGEGVPEEEIAADMNFLYSLWLDIRQKAEKKPAPALLHYDLDIVQRILRDQVTEEFKAIWVDNEDLYESILTFLQRFQPSLVSRVKMYTRTAPIFDAFNITQELEKALRPKVWLKSGGHIVINQTEALVAIDINTGKFVGKSNRLEDTIVKTNTEACKEIVRQIRLRDLGGIIVVDFIDMDERKNRQKVMQALEEAMQADRAPNKILQFNDFGLVAITRKRVKQSLERTLCAPCPHCEGAGYVKSVQTIIGEILVEAQKIARSLDGKDAVLRINPEVAKVMKASSNRYLEELEEVLGRPVLVVSDATLHSEKFDLT